MAIYFKDGGFYHSSVHNNIPSNAVEITEALYQSLLSDQSSGNTITSDSNGIPISAPYAALDAGEKKQSFLAAINAYISEIRKKIAKTTDYAEIAGWSYKHAVALSVADGTATQDQITMMQLEVDARGVTGETVLSLANLVITNGKIFGAVSAILDGHRKRATVFSSSIDASSDVDQMIVDAKTAIDNDIAQVINGL
jgi:hypothetical protein